MTVRPYPSVTRACHQLERHAQPEPEPVPLVAVDWDAFAKTVGYSNASITRAFARLQAAFTQRPVIDVTLSSRPG
ncbi:hypothetical protein [Streptacidiphilus carbonis]|uniref:hypothetical protein n=1 Tax=Streptacidiphilus carbonis TaxID=105422 RepID=UPI00126A2B2E|nr:hypothetical protein [Streptacidiphilus carbonis]